MTWVTYQDVVNRWSGYGDTAVYPLSVTVTETLIEDAEALIEKEFPDIDERLATNELKLVLVKQVVARMINTYIVNGGGLSQHSKTVGPYTESKSYSARTSRVYLELSEKDKELLAPSDKNSGIGSIETITSYGSGVWKNCGLTHADRMNGWMHWGNGPC